MLGDLVFLAFAVLTIGFAAVVAFARSVFSSALALVGVMIATAGLYANLTAGFAALTQFLLFGGGAFALLLLTVVFVPDAGDIAAPNRSAKVIPSLLLAAASCGLLARTAIGTDWLRAPDPSVVDRVGLGALLVGPALLPLLLASVVLVTATAGAIVLVRKDWRDQ